jgi:hypothetical protein
MSERAFGTGCRCPKQGTLLCTCYLSEVCFGVVFKGSSFVVLFESFLWCSSRVYRLVTCNGDRKLVGSIQACALNWRALTCRKHLLVLQISEGKQAVSGKLHLVPKFLE